MRKAGARKCSRSPLPCARRVRGGRISAQSGPASKKRWRVSGRGPRQRRCRPCTRTCSNRSRTSFRPFRRCDGQVGAMFLVNGRPGRRRAVRRAGDVEEALVETGDGAMRSTPSTARRAAVPSRRSSRSRAATLIDAVRSSQTHDLHRGRRGQRRSPDRHRCRGAALVARGPDDSSERVCHGMKTARNCISEIQATAQISLNR